MATSSNTTEQLHIVRQTLSKQENTLSVPDADILPQIATLFGVSVNELLDLPPQYSTAENLSRALAEAQKQLALYHQKELLAQQINQKRGLILLFSFLSVLSACSLPNRLFALFGTVVCTTAALIVFYRSFALLTAISAPLSKTKTLYFTNIFCFAVFLISGGCAFGLRLFAATLTGSVMIGAGILSPKLPHNRYTGLRLPWTVQDADTWTFAHRILNEISLPVALLYFAFAYTLPCFETVTACAVLIWLAVPSVLSYFFFRKRYSH